MAAPRLATAAGASTSVLLVTPLSPSLPRSPLHRPRTKPDVAISIASAGVPASSSSRWFPSPSPATSSGKQAFSGIHFFSLRSILSVRLGVFSWFDLCRVQVEPAEDERAPISGDGGRRKLLSRDCVRVFSMTQQISSSPELSKELPNVIKKLYSPIEPYSSGFLKVSKLHTLYWEQSGNPSGHPVVFLHGGPGSGTFPSNRQFFDPEFYRIILFDQRGAGRSTPHACLEENTTWDLVEDIEKLRKHLEIPEWQVFGGSWGSTLALAYSQAHPDKVTGLVLRGIFLLRKKELDWFYEGGAAAIFPDAWEPFRDFIPENERDNFIVAYSKRLNSEDPQLQTMAAKIWTTWELMTAHLVKNEENVKKGDDDHFSLAFARIENHYFLNKGFFPSDSYLLDNVEKLRHIKAVIVQGRYDVCCPMVSAWDLHKAWPEAELKVVVDAGHSANEPGIAAELVAANEKFKHFLKNGS